MLHWNLITIVQLVSEIFMFERVDPRTDGRNLPEIQYGLHPGLVQKFTPQGMQPRL